LKFLKIFLIITFIIIFLKPLYGQDTEGANESFNLGRKALEQGDYKRAIEYFREALQKDYKKTEAYYWIGYSYQKLGDFDEAINNYKETINYCPEMLQLAYTGMGQCEEATDKSTGLTHYKYAVSFIPGYEDIMDKNAEFRKTMGTVTQSKIEAYEELLEFHPFEPYIVKRLVIAYELKGYHKKCSELLKAILKEKIFF